MACVLVILDLTDGALRRWWDAHALTTDLVAGLLVLLITVLVIDQVVRLRQINNRVRVVAVQVAIMMTQANRASGSLPTRRACLEVRNWSGRCEPEMGCLAQDWVVALAACRPLRSSRVAWSASQRSARSYDQPLSSWRVK